MRLYVGHIVPSASIDDIFELVAPFGRVSHVSLKAGYGFVEFVSETDGEHALEALRNYDFHGQQLQVELSYDHEKPSISDVDKTRVRILHIPTALTGTFEDQMAAFGTVVACELDPPAEEGGEQSAWVFFETPDEAWACISSMKGAMQGFIGDERKTQRSSAGKRRIITTGRSKTRDFPSGVYQQHANVTDILENSLPLKILVPNRMVGAIIGKTGATIKDIITASGAKIDIQPREALPIADRVVFIGGPLDSIAEAYKLVAQKLEDEADDAPLDENAPAPIGDHLKIPLRILVPNELVGHLIGKQGQQIRSIMAESGTQITVSPLEDIFVLNMQRCVTVEGNLTGCCAAQRLILAKLSGVIASQPMGMMPMPMGMYGAPMYPGAMPFSPAGPHAMGPHMNEAASVTEKTTVFVPNGLVGAIIGRSGANIKEIHRYSNALVRVETRREREKLADAGENGELAATADFGPEDEREITISGVPDAQARAQWLIFLKLQEAAMNPQTPLFGVPRIPTFKLEATVPTALVGRLIGKRGMRIKEITKSSGAHLEVRKPAVKADGSESEETCVRVEGQFFETQMAQSMIRSVVMENRTRPPVVAGAI